MQLRKLQLVWVVLASVNILIAIGIVVLVMPGWEPTFPEFANYAIAAALLSALPALLYRKTFTRAKEDVLQQLSRSPAQPIAALGVLSQRMFTGAMKADLPAYFGVAHALMTTTVPFMIVMAIASTALKMLFRPPRQPA